MTVRIGLGVAAALLLASVSASAQPAIAIGGAVNVMKARDEALGDKRVTPGLVLRLAPKKGFGPSFGLSWFETDFEGRGELNIRPVMVGGAYTFGDRDLAVSVSMVGGYSFNKLRGIDGASIENAPAYRPGVSLWKGLHPRFGLNFFGGYVITRPNVTVNGIERKLKADYAVFSAGAAVVVF
jgi:hypothetical protein